MKLSKKGADFLAAHEGVVLRPYNDPAGHATVGVGHLIHRGPVTAADRAKYKNFTRADAIKLMRADAANAESYVNRSVKRKLTQNQFDALVSLVFNIGGPGFLKSTVLRELNAGHYGKAADAFLLWKMADGKPMLLPRRIHERKLFLSPQAHKVAKPARKVLPLAAGGWRAYVYGDVDCNKTLLVKLARVARSRKTRIFVRSGKRTYQEQVVLYNHYKRFGFPVAAVPGSSRHQFGRAADCGIDPGNRNIGDVVPRSVLRAHGLQLPVRGESWHTEEL